MHRVGDGPSRVRMEAGHRGAGSAFKLGKKNRGNENGFIPQCILMEDVFVVWISFKGQQLRPLG